MTQRPDFANMDLEELDAWHEQHVGNSPIDDAANTCISDGRIPTEEELREKCAQYLAISNGDYTTTTEIVAADGSTIKVETFLNDGELMIEVYRGPAFNPVLSGTFTAQAR